MPRRAKSGVNPVHLILILVAVGAVVGGGWLFLGRASDPFSKLTVLPVSDYKVNANQLRGNVYRTEGTIDDQLKWTPGKGRLFSVEITDGQETFPVGLLVPAEKSGENIQRGQTFIFKVEVGDGGTLIVQELQKKI